MEHYETLVADALAEGRFEPDYGTYFFDPHRGDLYLVAPERWHRLALVTSNSMLLADPERRLTWAQVRQRLEGAVVGFAGMSVGGNVLEGWLRDARPRTVKIADPDWVEITNFNRGERMSIRHLAGSRGQRFDARNPYEIVRVPKASYIAYEQSLVDPYTEFWVYGDGLDRTNLDRFLEGDGQDEPPIDILVEEMDNLELKLLARQSARRHRVDVFMASDLGHHVDVLWNFFREDPTSRLGKSLDDEDLAAALAATRGGDRSRFFALAEGLCGPFGDNEAFDTYRLGRGEHPTGSMPQSGATALGAGVVGGKELVLRVLGHHLGQPSPHRIVWDFAQRRVQES